MLHTVVVNLLVLPEGISLSLEIVLIEVGGGPLSDVIRSGLLSCVLIDFVVSCIFIVGGGRRVAVDCQVSHLLNPLEELLGAILFDEQLSLSLKVKIGIKLRELPKLGGLGEVSQGEGGDENGESAHCDTFCLI